MTEVLGPDHPETLTARHTLAQATEFTTDLPTWIRIYADEQRILGAEHPLTLSARYAIAAARRQLGDIIGARDEADALLPARQRTLGEQHPDTLVTRLAAAIWRGEAGDPAAAAAEFTAMIPTLTAVFGSDHEHALTARHTRALWTADNQTSELERLSDWEVLVDDETRALGDQHTLTIAGRETLTGLRAAWQASLDDYEQIARDIYYDMELEDAGAALSPSRPWNDPGQLDDEGIQKANDDAAEQKSEMAELMQAVIAAKKQVARVSRTNGDNTEAALTSRYKLAETFCRGHQFDEARQHTQRLIDDCHRVLGAQHALTAAARHLQADIASRRWN